VGGPATLEEVVVTAEKRTERLQDVPVPVTAISSETLTANNEVRLQDYYASVPGLSVNASGNGQTSIAIRGITTGGTAGGGGNATVGITIDDVPYGSSSVLGYSSALVPDIDPADLSRVEVLRGPQGTLYGASSIGGLLKYVTVDPSTSALTGRVQADVNDVQHGGVGWGIRGSVNVPLSDTFALRVSGNDRRDAGFIDDPTHGLTNENRNSVQGGRISALWRPWDFLSVKLSAMGQNYHGDGASQVEGNYLLQPTEGDLVANRPPGTGQFDIKSRLYSAVVNANFAGMTLTSVTAYGDTKYVAPLDFSGSVYGQIFAPALFNVSGASIRDEFPTKKWSQELRLASEEGRMIDWLVGAFYTHESTDADQSINAIDSTTGAFAGQLLNAPFPTTYREWALFGDLTVHFTSQFDVQLGARESQNRQSYEETDTGPLFLALGLPTDTVAYDPIHTKDNAFTYLVTPRFKFTPDLMGYARIASGYRPGGPNPAVPAVLPSSAYGPDKTNNYELGLKGSTPDRKLTFDASVYYIDWKDIQISITDPATGYVFFKNAGSAKSQGVELSLAAKPWNGMTATFDASGGIAKLKDPLPVESGAIGNSGDRLPNSAKFTGSLSLNQDFPLSDKLAVFLGATVSYVGEREGAFPSISAPGSPQYVRIKLPSYTTGDLRTGVRYDSWTVNLYTSNVTDRRGIVSGAPKNAGGGTVDDPFVITYIRPRTYGLSVSKDFGP
jgi:outer membrane receptor protein involved in Fe transport